LLDPALPQGLDVVRVKAVECGYLLIELVVCAFVVDITWSPERRGSSRRRGGPPPPPSWGGQI
jgi:hypothetical protein